MRRTATLLSLVLVSGCSQQSPAPRTVPAQQVPAQQVPSPPVTAQPAPPPTFSSSLRWLRTSAEYRAITIQTYRAALAAAERLSAGKAPGTWAVSVDADETIIDNSLFDKERQLKGGGPVDMAKWGEWVKRRERTATPGARTFLEGVRKLGGRVAVVTNTAESLCQDVVANLDSLGLPHDLVLCRPDAGGDRKEARWKAIAEGTARPGAAPLEILVFVGDNIQDFPDRSQELRDKPEQAFDDFGVRYFALPNPIYGTWEKNPAE